VIPTESDAQFPLQDALRASLERDRPPSAVSERAASPSGAARASQAQQRGVCWCSAVTAINAGMILLAVELRTDASLVRNTFRSLTQAVLVRRLDISNQTM